MSVADRLVGSLLWNQSSKTEFGSGSIFFGTRWLAGYWTAIITYKRDVVTFGIMLLRGPRFLLGWLTISLCADRIDEIFGIVYGVFGGIRASILQV
jgi:hypothetical protein